MEQFLPERTTERQVKACSRKRQAAFDPAGADSPPVFALGLRVKGPRFAKSRDHFFFFRVCYGDFFRFTCSSSVHNLPLPNVQSVIMLLHKEIFFFFLANCKRQRCAKMSWLLCWLANELLQGGSRHCDFM